MQIRPGANKRITFSAIVLMKPPKFQPLYRHTKNENTLTFVFISVTPPSLIIDRAVKWMDILQIPWFFYFLLLLHLHLLLHGILIILLSRKKEVTFTHCLSMKCLRAQAPDSLFLLLQKGTKQSHSEIQEPRCYSCEDFCQGKFSPQRFVMNPTAYVPDKPGYQLWRP